MTPPRDGSAKPPGSKPPGFKPGFRPRRPGPPRPPSHTQREGMDHVVLYGWHPVSQALANEGRRFHRLLATENALLRLKETLPALPIEPEIVRPGAIDRLLGPDAVHQGLYAEAEPLEAPALDAMPDDALLLAFDQITDPHNVGAIVRTAAAFGVTAIVTTARHSPNATGVMAKSASGGLEHVPLVVVRNLAEALITLGERGFTRIGLDSDAEAPLDSVGPRRPAVLVLGAEGKGLRQRTRECCDVLVRIDATGAIRSLNVSNAAAITLYALTRPA
ncbi:23S rRNA (guanosine(2251)-2'-O)-methyltransferase RlmB [Methylorubrum salsuginis]|uniref:23S rRNA (Guanosine2251-2'-O)-methyltransferase n=1 Tax=Methylorubrum salsuginis TaxID=414703 RepID=A0A1I4LUW2_9HYPH|nr:23S rRNA (guanosine(2251)-2'-O)-methyltransferase RlmB [Methylorubrum salsuginis]SFL94613.1 23S rRNA (guanosine2251-2'-O)-methyltransferase [Methylorubrum salsuginis]